MLPSRKRKVSSLPPCLVDGEGFEPPRTSRPRVYSPVPYLIGVPSFYGTGGFQPPTLTLNSVALRSELCAFEKEGDVIEFAVLRPFMGAFSIYTWACSRPHICAGYGVRPRYQLRVPKSSQLSGLRPHPFALRYPFSPTLMRRESRAICLALRLEYVNSQTRACLRHPMLDKVHCHLLSLRSHGLAKLGCCLYVLGTDIDPDGEQKFLILGHAILHA